MHSRLWFGACLGSILYAATPAFPQDGFLFDNPLLPARAPAGGPGLWAPAAAEQPPGLSIRHPDPDGPLQVSWPASASEWGLEYSTRWPGGAWILVSPLFYQASLD